MLDVDDLLNIVNYCKDKVNCETLKISGVQKIKLFTLCELIGILLNKKPIVKIIDNIKYDNWHVDNSSIINEAIDSIDSLNYTYTILKKYLS